MPPPCHKLDWSREELQFLRLVGTTETCALGRNDPYDDALIEWFWTDDNDTRVHEYLALHDLERPLEHRCSHADWEFTCFYRSESGHVRRSMSCPEVRANPALFGIGRDHHEPDGTLATMYSSRNWAAQERLDASMLDLSRHQGNRLPLGLMDRVLSGKARAEELWVLEGVVFRSLFRHSGRINRRIFAFLWAVVYKARRGLHLHYEYFRSLELACKAVMDIAKFPHSAVFHKSQECGKVYPWSSFLQEAMEARKRWSMSFDVFAGVVLTRDHFPQGSAVDEWGGMDSSDEDESDDESDDDLGECDGCESRGDRTKSVVQSSRAVTSRYRSGMSSGGGLRMTRTGGGSWVASRARRNTRWPSRDDPDYHQYLMLYGAQFGVLR